MPRIDFDAVSADALANAELLLHRWLPDGRRQGSEYKALNPTRGDSRLGSFSINTRTGRWGDFATGDRGGSLVGLCSYIFQIRPQEAAERIIGELGRSDTAYEVKSPFERRIANAKKRVEWEWEKPKGAPRDAIEHYMMGIPDVIYKYRTYAGDLIGYICRWENPNGEGKEMRPYNLFRHKKTGRTQWKFRQMPAPRPLYGLPNLRKPLPALLVEGEKTADAADRLIGSHFAVLSWSGGSNAVSRMDWSRLRDSRKIYLWPDADEAGRESGAKLNKILGLQMFTTPKNVAKGWDLADAESEGWTTERTMEYINGVK